MLPRSPDTDTFWQAFRRYAGLDHDNYVVGSFGDSPEMATELADLAMAGIKRGTVGLARDYGEGREPMPKPGDFVMMLDGERRPRFIWRTTEVTIKPLSQVDEAFIPACAGNTPIVRCISLIATVHPRMRGEHA